MEENPRVRETKRLLFGALLKLLETGTIAEVSVSALCRAAGVNRSTFYRYYRTPYDLLLAMHERVIDAFEEQTPRDAPDEETLTGVLRTMRAQPALNLALNEVLMRETFAGRLSQSPRDYIRRIFLDRMPEAAALYFSAALTAILQRWLSGGTEPPEEIAALLLAMARATGAWTERGGPQGRAAAPA